jgi:hypothetical protein
MGYKFIMGDSTWKQFIVQSFLIDIPKEILLGKKGDLPAMFFVMQTT